MTLLDEITPILITWNEEDNLSRALAKLDWARDIVVVDSGSTDGTLAILSSDPRVRVFPRAFSSFSEQWNYGLDQVRGDWVLTLDADYLLSDEVVQEMKALRPGEGVAGYSARFIYCALGRHLRGSLYPPRTVLFRRTRGSFYEEGHQQRLRLDGQAEGLVGPILHDDRKPLRRWLAAQDRYADIEAERLVAARPGSLDWPDRIRLLGVVAPGLAVAYALLMKGGLLDGRAGLYYAFQRGVAEAILALKLWERRAASD